MDKEGGVPVGFRAEHLPQQALPTRTRLPQPPPGLSGAEPAAGQEAAGKPRWQCQAPAMVPTALHINSGAGTRTATSQFVPEETGAGREDGVKLAGPAGCLVQDQLRHGCPSGILGLSFSAPWRVKQTSLRNSFRNMTFVDGWNWKRSGFLWSKLDLQPRTRAEGTLSRPHGWKQGGALLKRRLDPDRPGWDNQSGWLCQPRAPSSHGGSPSPAQTIPDHSNSAHAFPSESPSPGNYAGPSWAVAGEGGGDWKVSLDEGSSSGMVGRREAVPTGPLHSFWI